MNDTLPLPHAAPVVSDFLSRRRSNLARHMSGPGPDREALDAMLETAARVPDHRKLAPWRFVVIEGKARERLGAALARRLRALEPGLPPKRYEIERERFLRAPTVVAVVSHPVDCRKGTPEWEQVLSAGAVCFSLLLAAQSRGFAAQWLTEWYAYDRAFLAELGLESGEKIAGFIYLGSTDQAPTERPRPDLADKVSYA